ncbi:MAG: winged helix-turn-helix transcriptional regulator, partial [Denitromonas halophila]
MNTASQITLIRQRFERESTGRKLRTTLYLAVRHLILDGALPPGTPLPATRVLADELGFSRSTLVRVYEQLVVEGYLQSRGGASTIVS